jgi:hypothetical protein
LRGGGVQSVGDRVGEFFEPAGQLVQPFAEAVYAGLVEAPPRGVEVTSELGDLLGKRAERPGQPPHGGRRVTGWRVRR